MERCPSNSNLQGDYMKLLLLAILSLTLISCTNAKTPAKKYLCCICHTVIDDVNCFPPIIEPHPRDAEEMEREARENDPVEEYQRRILDTLDPDNAPHDSEDVDNWAAISRDNFDGMDNC